MRSANYYTRDPDELKEGIREKTAERAWKFIAAWEVVERELGREPTMREFADRWQISLESALQEKARFDEALLDERLAGRFLQARRETWRWEGGAHGSGRLMSCIRCGVQVVVPADSIAEAASEQLEPPEGEDPWDIAGKVLEEARLSGLSSKAILLHVSRNGACHWCRTLLPESGVTHCRNCRALNLNWVGERLHQRLPQVAFVWPMTDHLFRLADGRTLAYTERGVLGGVPVFFFHGSPHSRLWCPEPVQEDLRGIRCITVDRPGFGGSDPLPGRTVGSWPADLLQLADHLAFDSFGVIGWSSGGLYAAACAALIPERLTGVAVVSSRDLAHYNFAERSASIEGLDEEDRRAFDFINRFGAEEATRLLLAEKQEWAHRLRERPASIIDDLETPAGDRWFWTNATRTHPWLEAVRESVRQGPVGRVSDRLASLQPWGFRLADIAIPVGLWHGEQDPLIARFTQDFAVDTILRARLHIWPDAGHLGLAKHWAQIVQSVT